jgi:hypothetical protein
MLTTSLIAAALAQAQLEQTRESHKLPGNDFTSNWGEAVEDAGRDSPDFHVGGFEAGFQCELAGRFLFITNRITSKCSERAPAIKSFCV